MPDKVVDVLMVLDHSEVTNTLIGNCLFTAAGRMEIEETMPQLKRWVREYKKLFYNGLCKNDGRWVVGKQTTALDTLCDGMVVISDEDRMS